MLKGILLIFGTFIGSSSLFASSSGGIQEICDTMIKAIGVCEVLPPRVISGDDSQTQKNRESHQSFIKQWTVLAAPICEAEQNKLKPYSNGMTIASSYPDTPDFPIEWTITTQSNNQYVATFDSYDPSKTHVMFHNNVYGNFVLNSLTPIDPQMPVGPQTELDLTGIYITLPNSLSQSMALFSKMLLNETDTDFNPNLFSHPLHGSSHFTGCLAQRLGSAYSYL